MKGLRLHGGDQDVKKRNQTFALSDKKKNSTGEEIHCGCLQFTHISAQDILLTSKNMLFSLAYARFLVPQGLQLLPK